MPSYTNQIKLEVLKRLDEGATYDNIVREFNLTTKATISYWNRTRDKIIADAREDEKRQEVIRRVREGGESSSEVAKSVGLNNYQVETICSKRTREKRIARRGLEGPGDEEYLNFEEIIIDVKDGPCEENEDIAFLVPGNR